MHKACQIIRDTFSELIFDELTHTYIINGEILPSVSTLVSDFYEPFEIDKMSELCAQNSNKTAEEIRKEWENKGYNARMKGKRIHSFAQKYPNFPKPEIDEEYAIVDFIKNLPLRYEILIQEFPLYNSEYAGTPDMILLNKFTENIVILDWKTGNNLLKNYKNTKLKSPFQNYVDCPLHRYSIQLSLYKMLIEQKTPLKVEECWLIHLDKDKWIKHNALDLTKELIKHYDERKKFSSLL